MEGEKKPVAQVMSEEAVKLTLLAQDLRKIQDDMLGVKRNIDNLLSYTEEMAVRNINDKEDQEQLDQCSKTGNCYSDMST